MTTAARKAFAPSCNLLRFLKAQNESLHFFTPSGSLPPTNLHVHHRHHGSVFQSHGGSKQTVHRAMTTCAPVIVPLESSISLLDNLWTRRSRTAKTSTLEPLKPRTSVLPSVQPHQLDRQCPTKYLSRPASTTRARADYEKGHGRLWGLKRNRPKTPLQPDDLPPLAGFLDDPASFGRTLRPGNELKLRCTEFDEQGNVTLVNGEFKKSELIAKYGLLPRDLRKIDSSLLPNILVRPSAILINLLHLRVLIKHNRVLVLDAYGSTDSYTQSLFMYDLEGKLRSPEARASSIGALPYEFRALEAVLISVTTSLEAEFEGVREPVVRVLRELEEDIDRDKLRHLLIYSKKLGTFEQKARLVRDAIDDLLEADDDLAALYLTEKAASRARRENDHTEVEMLLESYHKVCDEIVQVSGNLVSNIRNTEEIVRAILDANRNSLMLLDLKFSIGTLALGGGTFVAALYGMNLKNFIEESDFGFWGVSVWSAVLTVLVGWVGLRRLRHVQRLTMWGGSGGADATRGKSGWTKLARGDAAEGSRLGRSGSSNNSNSSSGGVNGAGVAGRHNDPMVSLLRRERLREGQAFEHATPPPPQMDRAGWTRHRQGQPDSSQAAPDSPMPPPVPRVAPFPPVPKK